MVSCGWNWGHGKFLTCSVWKLKLMKFPSCIVVPEELGKNAIIGCILKENLKMASRKQSNLRWRPMLYSTVYTVVWHRHRHTSSSRRQFEFGSVRFFEPSPVPSRSLASGIFLPKFHCELNGGKYFIYLIYYILHIFILHSNTGGCANFFLHIWTDTI